MSEMTTAKRVGFLPPTRVESELSSYDLEKEPERRPREKWTLGMLEQACYEFRASGAWEGSRIEFVRDTEVGATYDIPRVEAEVLTQPIELPYAIKPVTQAPPQPPDPFRPRKGSSGPAWTFHLFGYGLLVALILGGLVERLA